MSLQDLATAFKMFNDGVKEYAIGSGIRGAQQQVMDLKAQALDEVKERQGLAAISQGLTMQLASIGAPLGQMQAAVGAVAPAAIKDANEANMQGLLSSTTGGTLADLAKKQQRFEETPKLNLAKVTADTATKRAEQMIDAQATRQEAKLNQFEKSALLKAGKEFNSEAKKFLEGKELANSALEVLANGNPIGDKSVTTFMAKASGEVGALSEADKAPYGGSQAIVARLKQASSNMATGTLTDENRAFLASLTKTIIKNNDRSAKSFAIRKAKTVSRTLGKSPEEVLSKIYPDAEMTGDADQSALPPGIPEGSVEVTNSQGVKAWKTPDGRYLQVD